MKTQEQQAFEILKAEGAKNPRIVKRNGVLVAVADDIKREIVMTVAVRPEADISKVFAAGRVRRWHSNPVMSDTDDRNDAHQGRVARIILALHPAPSKTLLIAALTHDDGELKTGDMSGETKKENPELREMLRGVEQTGQREVWGEFQPNLYDSEKVWLRFADRLDAYLWMLHTAPQLAERDDWKSGADWLRKTATALDVWHDIAQIINDGKIHY